MPDNSDKDFTRRQPSPKDAGASGLELRRAVMSGDITESALQQIMVTSGHAYTLWAPGNSAAYVSESLALMLGYASDFFATSSADEKFLGLIHELDRPAVLSTLKVINSVGGDYEQDYRMLRADGHYRWFRIRGTSFEHDASGTPTKLVGCISDINEIKVAQFKAERAQEKSDWLRRISAQLFESLDPDNIRRALESLAGKMACDRSYLRLINPVTNNLEIVAETFPDNCQPIVQTMAEKYEPGLFNNLDHITPGKSIIQIATKDLSGLRQQIARDLGIENAAVIPLLQNGELLGELTLISSGDIHWHDEDLQLAKEFSHLVSLAYERQANAQGLKESDERFRLAMEASQDGLWDALIGLDQVYVSPSYFRMAGVDLPGGIYPREITGTYVHPDDLQMVRESLSAFVRSDLAYDSIEFRVRHTDGSDVWVLSRMYKAEFNPDGSPSRIFGVNTDITEFKRIQNYLTTAQTEADSANRAKSEFLARMSHEIRTPMNAILGLSHLMLDGNLQPEQRNYIKHIDDAGHLLLNVINDILDFSKIEAGKLELDETDFNLDEVISSLANLLIYRAEEKGIRLVIDIAPEVPSEVHGDITRLQQILVNLLNNAIKFTNEGSVRLGISLDRNNHFIFDVEDSGIGIDKDALQSLFTPFTQADGSVTRQYGGTGLGLAICKHLVDMLGGSISVESRPDIGSHFRVELPLSFTQASTPVATASEVNVAIICDHPATAAASDHLFRRQGAEPKLYSTLGEFVSTLKPGLTYLCLVDDETVVENDLKPAINALRQRTSVDKVRLAYLSNNNLCQQRKQRFSDTVDICPKPLTTDKVHSLLFEEADGTLQANTDEKQDQWRGYKLLLVEDNPVNQKVALGMLKKYGFELDMVTDGQQAIDRLQRLGPDYYKLVLMDMEMPVMDGYAAARQIRSDATFDKLPMIAMTAHAMKGDRDRCLEAGLDDYLSKPIDPELLFNTLSRYLQPPG